MAMFMTSHAASFARLSTPQSHFRAAFRENIIIPPEQKENIQKLITHLQDSIDSCPTEDSIAQWQTTVYLALADDLISRSEWWAIAQASLDVLYSMGLTNAEIRIIAYDLQNIAEASRRPREDELLIGTSGDDVLRGKTGTDTLVGTPAEGRGEIDMLIGGGGTDTFILGDKIQAYYDDGLSFTLGLQDYALIVDFNIATDTIQLHGTASNYSLGALPADSPIAGTGIYRTADSSSPELIGIAMGIAVNDFSQGFAFVG
jgi:hypothetical protein